MNIHILAIDTGHQPHIVRLAAEYWYWQASVTVSWVGNSQQIVDYFTTPPMHDIIIISGHGDERGLLLPELAPEIQHHYPYNGVVTPADFDLFLPTLHAIVLNMACLGGLPTLADVFLAHGAQAYIGAIDYPEASASLMYTLEWLYTYLHNGHNIATAHTQASGHTDDRQHFRLYQP